MLFFDKKSVNAWKGSGKYLIDSSTRRFRSYFKISPFARTLRQAAYLNPQNTSVFLRFKFAAFLDFERN